MSLIPKRKFSDEKSWGRQSAIGRLGPDPWLGLVDEVHVSTASPVPLQRDE